MRLTDAFIVAWIVLQIALPVSYYVARDDPYDERFAWRMFSPTRMVGCRMGVFIGGPDQYRRGEMRRDLHNAWLGWIRRGRMVVAEGYLSWRCEREREAGVDAPWVSLQLDCRAPGGEVTERLSRHDNACAEP